MLGPSSPAWVVLGVVLLGLGLMLVSIKILDRKGSSSVSPRQRSLLVRCDYDVGDLHLRFTAFLAFKVVDLLKASQFQDVERYLEHQLILVLTLEAGGIDARLPSGSLDVPQLKKNTERYLQLVRDSFLEGVRRVGCDVGELQILVCATPGRGAGGGG